MHVPKIGVWSFYIPNRVSKDVHQISYFFIQVVIVFLIYILPWNDGQICENEVPESEKQHKDHELPEDLSDQPYHPAELLKDSSEEHDVERSKQNDDSVHYEPKQFYFLVGLQFIIWADILNFQILI